MAEPGRRALLWGRAWGLAIRLRSTFDEVRCFCFFLGWPRSGHSIVGTLLNAHPNAVISHELNVLEQVRRGRPRNHVYGSILLRDRWFENQARRSQGYDYHVPGQHQGRYNRLEVIGDKNAGVSSRLLGREPGLLARLRERVGVPLRIIQIVRNPWDTIATISRMHDMTLAQAQAHFFRMAEDQRRLEPQLRPSELHRLYHEDFVSDPATHLTELARFLGLEPDSEWLRAATEKVFVKGIPSSAQISWRDEVLASIDEQLERYEALRRWSEKRPPITSG